VKKRWAEVLAVGAVVISAGVPAHARDFDTAQGRIAYSEYVEDDFRLMVMRSDGSGAHRLGNTAWTLDPEWSPDGKRIAVSGFRSGFATGAAQIFVMSADGSQARQVTLRAGYKRSPSWSPDGRMLAYSADVTDQQTAAAGRESCELRTVDLHSGAERVVYAFGGYAWAGYGAAYATGVAQCAAFPRWSPRGDWIAFSRGDAAWAVAAGAEREDLYVVHPDGTGLRQLVRDVAPGEDWSPDGKRIAYVALDNVSDKTLVRTVGVDAGDVRDVATAGYDGGFPAFSPDGRSVVVQSSPDGSGAVQLFRVALSDGAVTQLTHSDVDHLIPDWGR
jgi:TolB protein